MSQPSSEDIQASFDPTGYSSISGAQLLQLISGATPYIDKGMCVVTTDIATVPQVPDAAGTPKWQNYLWIRISATSVGAYLWNQGGPSDATLLKWTSISVSTIGNGTIVNAMIADNTITDQKIASLDYSKIINPPGNLPPSGAASGDLTGNYPGPSITALAVTTGKIANNAVGSAQLANQAVGPTQLANDGVALDMTRVNGAANAIEWFSPPKIFTSGIVIPTGNSLKIPQVNVGATDFQMVTLTALLAQARFATVVPGSSNLSAGSQILNSAHGLGATPTVVRGVMVCLSGDAGYGIGDEIDVDDANLGGVQAFTTGCNNTNVFMAMNSSGGNLDINHKTTGVTTAATQSKWYARIYAQI